MEGHDSVNDIRTVIFMVRHHERKSMLFSIFVTYIQNSFQQTTYINKETHLDAGAIHFKRIYNFL